MNQNPVVVDGRHQAGRAMTDSPSHTTVRTAPYTAVP